MIKIKNYKLLSLMMFFVVLSTSKAKHEHHKATSAVSIQALAHQAYTEDSNTVVIRTNDLSLIADSIIEFRIYAEGISKNEPVDIEISNPEVVKSHNKPAAYKYTSLTGQLFRLRPINFGRSSVTVIPTKSPNLRQSFSVYIENLDLTMADSVFNASIRPLGGDHYIEPLLNHSPRYPSRNYFLLTKHLFTAEGLHQASEFAQLQWEVTTKGETQHPTRISLNKRRDSATIYFSKGGNYTIYLKHKNSLKQSIIDSIDFSVFLPKEYTSDLKTGQLPYYIDNRDGQKYKLFHLEDGYRPSVRLVYMEHLRYLPYVSKLNAASPDPKTSPYIYVFGNNTTEDPDLIRPQLSSNSLVVYSKHAALFLPYGNAVDKINKENVPSNFEIPSFQGICPKGFFLPTSTLIQEFTLKNYNDQTSGYRNTELRDFLLQGAQQDYRGNLVLSEDPNSRINFASHIGTKGRDVLAIERTEPLYIYKTGHLTTAPERVKPMSDLEAVSVMCVFSEWYHREE